MLADLQGNGVPLTVLFPSFPPTLQESFLKVYPYDVWICYLFIIITMIIVLILSQ